MENPNNILNEKNIHIWDGNIKREFLDKRGLSHYPQGDMGETYFNFDILVKYIDCGKIILVKEPTNWQMF